MISGSQSGHATFNQDMLVLLSQVYLRTFVFKLNVNIHIMFWYTFAGEMSPSQ